MTKIYEAPFVEFIRITGDALNGSTEQKTDNNTKGIQYFFDDSDDFESWTLF